jgi:hypothetical protein
VPDRFASENESHASYKAQKTRTQSFKAKKAETQPPLKSTFACEQMAARSTPCFLSTFFSKRKSHVNHRLRSIANGCKFNRIP